MELLEEGLVPRLIALDEGDWKRFDTLAKILSSVRLLAEGDEVPNVR